MSSLREIKTRIATVTSTLKTTSAMKLVSSAKLRKSQNAIRDMLPYQAALQEILSEMLPRTAADGPAPVEELSQDVPEGEQTRSTSVALIAIASNSSLCGGFNSAIIRSMKERVALLESQGLSVSIFPIGKKVAEAARKAGYTVMGDWHSMSGKPSYDEAAAFAQDVFSRFDSGEFCRVEMLYSHFVSAGRQEPVFETWLPFAGHSATSQATSGEEFIIEPGKKEILDELIPKVLKLKIYTTLLDAAASEHAARTVAMQTASDNGEKLLGELSLEYNKSRQQKITSEILDLMGGAQ